MSDGILIIGAGPMAVAYAKVLQDMKKAFVAIGRGEKSAQQFKGETGVTAHTGGLDSWLAANKQVPRKAIVAVSENILSEATRRLIENGVEEILVEKPGGFLPRDIRELADLAKSKSVRVYVGYNRRFYASAQAAKRLIEAEGGVSSFHVEFTEWGHVLEKLVKPEGVMDQWFLHNSSHVIDLAFYLGGLPKTLSSFVAGSLAWHKSGSKYVGAGVTDAGALFSYHANWGAPGRWNLEILTAKNRYIFRPVERLQVQKLGTVSIEEVAIEDELDKKYKPGIYRQTEAFLQSDSSILETIEKQASHLPIFEKMETGTYIA